MTIQVTMRLPIIVLLSVLLQPSLTQDEEKVSNLVVQTLNKILQNIGELTSKEITIPRLDLDKFGWFENVTVSVSKMANKTDGVGKFGFKLDAKASDILATGYYNVRDVDVPGLFPFFGEGHFDVFVNAVNVKLKVSAMKNYEKDKVDFTINPFDVGVEGVKLNFENLMGDPHVSDFLNELIGNLIPKVVEGLREPMLTVLSVLFDYYGNGVVKCIETQFFDLENCIKELFETVAADFLHQFQDSNLTLSGIVRELFSLLPSESPTNYKMDNFYV